MNSYKILLVDDVVEQLKATYRIIEKYHPTYKVYQTNSADSAIELMHTVMPDIIVSDWEMPGMNGIEFIHHLKSKNEFCNIPVIIVSGVMSDYSDLKTALEAGAMDYIKKPIHEIELLARIHSALIIAEKHKSILKEKENKIAEHLMFANEVNTFLKKAVSNIKSFCSPTPAHIPIEEKAQRLIDDIEMKIKGTGWQDYSKAFNNLHPEFTRRLLQRHPDLTPKEIEICKLSRLGLSIKELADLMYVTPESMKVSRSRLRKKLQLDPNQNFETYFATL